MKARLVQKIEGVGLDVYRIHGYADRTPYRARVNGQLMRNKTGEVRRFRTMEQAIKATEVAAC
jgi:hypothetical protein